MKKLFALLLTALLFCMPLAFAENMVEQPAEAAPWYELSDEDSILTVWLDDARGDEMSWQFEVSNPVLELLTQEVVDNETLESMTYAASFRSFAAAENNVSLILKYNTPDSVEAPAATRVLEMKVSDKNVISVLSVLDRRQTFDWLEYDADNRILIVRLPEQSTEEYSWTLFLLDPELLELTACDTENGYNGSFASFAKQAGSTELTLSYGRTGSDMPEIMYTVHLTVSEDGELTVRWAETFVITQAARQAVQ